MTAAARLLALLATAALGACGAEPRLPLRVGVLVFPPYELFFLAEHRGLLPESTRLVSYRSPSEIARAYESGVVDAMTTTLEYALHLQDASDTHRVVLVIDVSHGADALVARPELETLAALRGRRVGVESGELGRYVLTRALDHAGLAASAIEIVPIDHADQEEAFRAGRVDAVVTYDPIRTRLLADGARALFDSRSIPGEIVDVLVVRQSLVESRRTELRGLVRGWFAAARDFAADPSGSAAIMARREGLGVEELLTALEGVHLPDAAETEALLAGRDPRLVDSIRRRAESLAAAGVVDRLPDLETLFDASIVVEARE